VTLDETFKNILHKEKDEGSIVDQFRPEEIDVFLDQGNVCTVNHELALFLQTNNFILVNI